MRSLHVRGIPKFRGGCEAYAHHVEFGYVLVGMGINKLNFLLMVRYSEVTLLVIAVLSRSSHNGQCSSQMDAIQ